MAFKVVIVNGVAAHGKDSFAKFASEYFDGITINHSTVDTVKKAAKFFGADQDVHKGDAERRLWSDMKDAWTRYNDGPFKEIIQKVEDTNRLYRHQQDIIVFVHAREPGEIQKVKNYFGKNCITVLVVMPENGHIPDNHADQNVFEYVYDLIVQNDGTIDDLKAAAVTFIQQLDMIL